MGQEQTAKLSTKNIQDKICLENNPDEIKDTDIINPFEKGFTTPEGEVSLDDIGTKIFQLDLANKGKTLTCRQVAKVLGCDKNTVYRRRNLSAYKSAMAEAMKPAIQLAREKQSAVVRKFAAWMEGSDDKLAFNSACELWKMSLTDIKMDTAKKIKEIDSQPRQHMVNYLMSQGIRVIGEDKPAEKEVEAQVESASKCHKPDQKLHNNAQLTTDGSQLTTQSEQPENIQKTSETAEEAIPHEDFWDGQAQIEDNEEGPLGELI